ncbi:hypothetical protein [Roseovarius pacificus]|uniref:hypothetical protein n=1 Tax=Roseovarius pacificus TaxID=337701 RepID=UPI002A18E868|nr:hypothetical protein [Roseovarius pacificus]
MADKFRNMKLNVHRAYLPDDVAVSLQKILEGIHDALPKHSEREAQGSSLFDNVVLSEFKTTPANNAVGAIFSVYEKGAKASTLDFATSEERLEQSELSAGENEEFLSCNISILVEGNHVISCGMGSRSKLVIDTIMDLAKNADIIASTGLAKLAEVPHNPTIEEIQKHGVKSVDLNVSNYLASLPKQKNPGLIAKLFGSVNSAKDLEMRNSLVANLSIRKRKLSVHKQFKDTWLTDVATTILNEEDISNYKIILGNDTEITAHSMTLSKSVQVRRKAATFNLDHAHQLMIAYLRELKENGLLT